MQRTIQAPPEKIIAEATAFMVNHGASVQGTTDTTATFVAREAPAFGLAGSLVGGWVLGWDAMYSATTAANTISQNPATIVATSGDGGTVVTLPDSQLVASNLLRFWLLANALREPLANPMGQFRLGSHQWWVWADRIEDYRRSFTWKLKDTLPLEDVATVATPKKSLIVALAKDGRELKFKGLPKDKTQQAKELIESRMEIYASPPLGGEHHD